MTIEAMREVLADVQFRDWDLGVYEDHGPYLQVTLAAPDSLSGEGKLWGGRKWRLSAHMTHSEVIQTALAAVLGAVEHEAREDFKYRGFAIFGPHHNVDALVGIAQQLRA